MAIKLDTIDKYTINIILAVPNVIKDSKFVTLVTQKLKNAKNSLYFRQKANMNLNFFEDVKLK